MIRTIALLLAGCGLTFAAAAAEPETPPTPDAVAAPAPDAAAEPAPGEQARAYLALGLVAVSNTLSGPLGDADSSGGGLVLNGALHSRPVNPSLEIALRGAVAITGREFDGGGETGDALIEMDGGLRISKLLLLSLGYTTQAVAYDTSPDVVLTYNIYPVGLGVFHATDSGYMIGQVRVGGGQLANDQNDDTESVGYFGLRAVFQRGFGSGAQFMLGVGYDKYDVDDLDQTEEFFRVEAGIGFGL
jgi:hypothetical protein